MAVKIRMRRMGNNKNPFFRIIVLDGRKKMEGRYLEMLGWYDPRKKGNNFELKMDRVEYWTSQGAKLSDTVRSLVRKVHRRAKAAAAA